jgi:DNA-binding Lrp family transcriptional regulator
MSSWPPTRRPTPAISPPDAAQPEIVGAWTLTGEADYLLRVYCADLDALNRLVQGVLLPHPAVSRVQSQIVMDRIKPDAPLPL